jgi:hypothetical protein
VAPPALNNTALPEQRVFDIGLTVTVGTVVTLTEAVAVAEQVPVVPVIVYIVVIDGFAVTVLPEVALSPVAGAQA